MSDYLPEPSPSLGNSEQVVDWIRREFDRISNAISFGKMQNVYFLNEEPSRVWEGLTVGADGTNWDPGSGQGVYTYYNSTWNKLG